MNNEINYVSPFKKFCISVGNLPTAYLESMSYYEGLTFLVNYLANNVIPALNNNGEVVEELQAKFTELKNYVDTYFDNLDVQEEINVKLDAMADDGTLQEIMADYLNVKAIFGFDSVADMKVADNLVNGSYAETLGYYSKGDGGSALYKIREITNDDVVDEMYIIQITTSVNLVAEMIINNTINSKQCGLVGDGSTDETVKLNYFFSSKTDYPKILTSGVYRITDKVLIKGKWRRDDNTYPNIKFENATIYYDGTDNGVSVVLFNMFKYHIDGLSIARNSSINTVQMIGCWHVRCSDWDISSLDITSSTSSIAGQTTDTVSSEYISFINAYIKGTLTISCTSGHFINCINFYNSIIYSTDKDYCVKLMGPNSKQEINFINSDLSYATNSVFYVDETQTGNCGVNCIGCYFDSGIKMFYNDDKKNVQFNNLCGFLAANTNQEVCNLYFKDFTTNINIGGVNQFGYNLPTSNVNYATNGDFSNPTTESGNYGYLTGESSANWTKSWVDSNLSTSGKARKMKYNSTPGSTKGFNIKAISAPRDNIYTPYIRAKIIAGSCDEIIMGFGGYYVTISASRLGNNEFVISNSKNVTRTAGQSLDIGLEFSNLSADFEIEFYEVGITDGKTYIPNARLHQAAVLS